MAISKTFQSTATPFHVRELRRPVRLLADPVSGAPVGVQNENANGSDGIWTPIDLTAAQIAAPTAEMLADLNSTFRLNVAPYTRYVSTGTALVQQFVATTAFAATLGDGTGTPTLTFNGAAATSKGLIFRNAGVSRWRLLTDASEGFNLFAYDSGGAFLDTAWGASQSAHAVTFNYQIVANNTYAPATGGTTGAYLTAVNNGTNAAYGHRVNYSSIAGGAGFDTGFGVIATVDPVFIGATVHSFQSIYFVMESPNEFAHQWSGNIGEMNFVNRGADIGFKRSRADAGNNSGGLLFVPESIVPSGGAGEGKNVTYAYSVSGSSATNSTGFRVKTYAGFLVEPNAIVGLTGRAFYATGDITSTASQRPYGPVQSDGTWLHGIDHTLATYTDGNATTMLAGQGVAWIVGTTTTPTSICFDTAGTGTPEGVVTANKGSTYRRFDGGAGTCFYVKESGTGNTGWVAK